MPHSQTSALAPQGLAHRSWAFPNWHLWVCANPAAPGQMGDVSGPWVPHLQNGGGTTTACFTGGLRCSVGWRRALDESVGMRSHSTVTALSSWMNSIPRSLSFLICKTGGPSTVEDTPLFLNRC